MFIGYQGELATFVTNTREELMNSPFIELSGIKEVEFAEIYNGVVYTSEEELFEAKTKAVEETRAGLYARLIDPLHARKARKVILNDWSEADEAEYVAEVSRISKEIEDENPYIVEDNSDSVLSGEPENMAQ